MLSGKRVVLGVSGGIAAYKSIELCRRFVDAGAFVSPVLTPDSLHFITEPTFSALASEPARVTLWDSPEPSPHTHLGQSADLIVVAPATARVLAAYAIGMSDDLLVATLMATRAPVVVCPAMHTEMWEQPAVQANVALLRERGVRVIDPVAGPLAGGDVGVGRLADVGDIVAVCEDVLSRVARDDPACFNDLAGLSVVVSAGGTREAIDPVRYIGNRSSGKQGHAIADEAARRGASVVLVTTAALPVDSRVEVVRVESAAEMEEAMLGRGSEADVIVMAAAVADFRPKVVAGEKIKKTHGPPEVVLEPTLDILAELGARKRDGQTLVGFAAETTDVGNYARQKLKAKNLDLIVANDVSAANVGFEHDTNAVVIFDALGNEKAIPLTDKRHVACFIIDAVALTRSLM